MKNLFHLLLLGFALCCASVSTLAQRQPARRLHYSFDLSDPSRIHVKLEFPARKSSWEILLLPSQWAGQTELYRATTGLRAATPDTTLIPSGKSSRWLIHTRHSGHVRIEYDLSQDWSGPLRHPLEHRVILGPGLFEFTGDNGLVTPVISGPAPVTVTFDFTGLPPGQSLLTSFGTDRRQQFTGAWSDVRNALFTGGDLNTRTLDVDGHPVLLALHGRWSFQPQEIASEVAKILRTERRLWSDTAIPYSAIVIAPYDDAASGGGGSGFTNIFNLFLTDTESFSADTASLLAHEAFHHWNPSGLGSVEDTQQIAWFGEGFTSFYQDLVLKQAGLLTEPQYLARLNATIKAYQLSPRLHATNDDLQRIPAEDRFAYQQPYLRGAMIALWLNFEIDRQSGGQRDLTTLMLALRSEHSQPLTADRIFRTAARFVDAATVAQLRSFALDGATVPIAPGSLGECVAFNDRPAWTFDLGFNVASLHRAGIVQGTQQGSNAWQAGVRDGQQLGGFSLWNGNAEREVTLTLRDTDGRREQLTFLPRGKLISIPQAEQIPGCVSSKPATDN